MTDNQSTTGSTNGTVLYINGTNKQINKLISIHTTQSTFKQFMKRVAHNIIVVKT